MIADYARQFDFMFLVEFHAAGLYPFLQIDQNYLADDGFLFNDLNRSLSQQIAEGYFTAKDILSLTNKLDHIFLTHLTNKQINPTFSIAFEKLLKCKGDIRVKDLASETYYSEKQLNRLFMKYAGAQIKTCSRISRLFEQTGHYDDAHFLRDFSDIYGITPKKYLENMSVFYNDPYKFWSYTLV